MVYVNVFEQRPYIQVGLQLEMWTWTLQLVDILQIKLDFQVVPVAPSDPFSVYVIIWACIWLTCLWRYSVTMYCGCGELTHSVVINFSYNRLTSCHGCLPYHPNHLPTGDSCLCGSFTACSIWTARYVSLLPQYNLLFSGKRELIYWGYYHVFKQWTLIYRLHPGWY